MAFAFLGSFLGTCRTLCCLFMHLLCSVPPTDPCTSQCTKRDHAFMPLLLLSCGLFTHVSAFPPRVLVAQHCAPWNYLESLKNRVYTYTRCNCYNVQSLRHTKNNVSEIPISLYFRRVRSRTGDQPGLDAPWTADGLIRACKCRGSSLLPKPFLSLTPPLKASLGPQGRTQPSGKSCRPPALPPVPGYYSYYSPGSD